MKQAEGLALRTAARGPTMAKRRASFDSVACKVWLGCRYIDATSGRYRSFCANLSVIEDLIAAAAEGACTTPPDAQADQPVLGQAVSVTPAARRLWTCKAACRSAGEVRHGECLLHIVAPERS